MKIEISKIIPGIILFTAVLDFSLRFFPIDWLSYRAWEPLSRYPALNAPFQANSTFQSNHSYGDLVNFSNLPQYKNIRSEKISTDKLGFRKNGSIGENNSTPPQIILAGDSFAISLGVNDNETLASQIEKFSGLRTYNGGGVKLDPAHILSLAKKLHVSSGTIIYEYLGRHDLPTVDFLSNSEKLDPAEPHWKNKLMTWKEQGETLFHGFAGISPLQILVHKLFLRIQNDKIMPNIFSSKVLIFSLINGSPMLFYPLDVELFEKSRKIDLSGFIYLNEELKKNNFDVIFVLVPDKYTVYRPLLQIPPKETSDAKLYLNRVEVKCKQAGLQVVNLSDFLRDKAKEELQNGKLIYFPDDTHWNAHGIEFAAQKICAYLRSLV